MASIEMPELHQTSDSGWIPQVSTWYLVRSTHRLEKEDDELCLIYRPNVVAGAESKGGDTVKVDCVWNLKYTEDIEDLLDYFENRQRSRWPRVRNYQMDWAKNLESFYSVNQEYKNFQEISTEYKLEVLGKPYDKFFVTQALGSQQWRNNQNATNFLTFVLTQLTLFANENDETESELLQKATFSVEKAKTQLRDLILKPTAVTVDEAVDVIGKNSAAIDALVQSKFTNPLEADRVEEKVLDSIFLAKACTKNRLNNYSKKPFIHLWYIANASVIAGIGLATNSGAVVVASMLVSSMMEPIKGMATALRHVTKCDSYQMKRFAQHFQTLMIDVVLCVIFGLIIGACVQLQAPGAEDDVSIMEHLTGFTQKKNNPAELRIPQEMSQRAEPIGLAVTCFVALASALALITADKQQNKSALVGIGISASLLPPAVNCGMLWSFASQNRQAVDQTLTFSQQGGVSLALTFVNVAILLIVWSVGHGLRKWCMKENMTNKFVLKRYNEQEDRFKRTSTWARSNPMRAGEPGEECEPLLQF